MRHPDPCPVILLAENDALTVRFVRSLLEKRGYRVLHSSCPREALRMSVESRVSLIVGNPGISPREHHGLLRAVRRNMRLANVPFITLSNGTREEDAVRCFEEGTDDYLTRPFRARELVARIRRLLERAEGNGGCTPT
ncbi:MAG: response regulator [Gemmatimonadota bacterium]|nr:response regulator [Gemmatimonadota bacterium]